MYRMMKALHSSVRHGPRTRSRDRAVRPVQTSVENIEDKDDRWRPPEAGAYVKVQERGDRNHLSLGGAIGVGLARALFKSYNSPPTLVCVLQYP